MNSQVKPSPLGRGLSALFGDTDASYQAKSAPVQVAEATVAPLQVKSAPPQGHSAINQLPVSRLQPGAFQPRRVFNEEALKGLADSIRERGILEPLVVRPVVGSIMFEIIAGERRWRAAQLAGLHDAPVVVRDLSDRAALEFGIIENVQRQDLSPLEEAEGYQRLLEEFGHTQENLAKIVGKSRPHIANLLRVLTLPPGVKQMIEEGQITLGHARAVIMAKDPLAVAKEVAKKGLNVRQVEALVKRLAENPQTHKRKTAAPADADVAGLEKELERVIGLKVKIQSQGKAGSISFYYQDLDQLDEIIRKLRG